MCIFLRRCIWALGIVLLAAGPGRAFELQLGLGHDGLPFRQGRDGFGAALTVTSAPLARLGPVDIQVGGAVEMDDRADVWVGLGPAFAWSFTPRWRLMASLMAGGYAYGDGHDLGSELQFKTALGASRSLGDGPWRAGVSVEHKSNAGLADRNPGVESIFLTVSREF